MGDENKKITLKKITLATHNSSLRGNLYTVSVGKTSIIYTTWSAGS